MALVSYDSPELKNYRPPSLAAYEIGETFLNLIQADEPHKNHVVEMTYGEFNLCGTVACHAGWFGVASTNLNDFCPSRFWVSGAWRLAFHLGFESLMALRRWADENPDIWGNSFGTYMFHQMRAFNRSTDARSDLERIAHHWIGVAERLAKLEEENARRKTRR